MTFTESYEYVLGIPRFTKKNSLQSTREFYACLGEPGGGAKIIHIAGTNGKGSVCAYLRSILRQQGKTTGMFTSPHLTNIRERFMINDSLAGEEEFVETLQKILGAVDRWNREKGVGREDAEYYHPTFFELMFFIAMVLFDQRGVEYIILETGMGGRLDATNVIRKPAVTVITKIGLDHMEYLGDTKEQIALEKAGIIKEAVPVVYWASDDEVRAVIEKKARENDTKTLPVSIADVTLRNFKKKSIDFSMESRYYGYIKSTLHTCARYQLQNAALAVRTAEVIGAGGCFTREAVEEGLKSASWEGRMEEVMPGVFLDGAHNQDGIESFIETVESDGCSGRRLLLFSVVSDKQYEKMADMLISSHLFDRITAAGLRSARSATQEQLEQLFRQFIGTRIQIFDSADSAFDSLVLQKREEDLIYVVGSLYLVGEIKARLRRVSCDQF